MADAGVIIKADLKEEDLTRKIDKLVQDVDNKFKDMADKVDASIQKVANSLGNFKTTAQTNVREIKDAFQQLGTTFDQFARAMERAAATASGTGRNGRRGTGGSGGSSGAVEQDFSHIYQKTIGELKQLITEQQKYIDTLQIGTAELQKQVDKLERGKTILKDMSMSSSKFRQQVFKEEFGTANSMSTSNLTNARTKLVELRSLMSHLEAEARRLGMTKVDFLPQKMWNQLQKAIDTTEQKIQRLKNSLSQPLPNTMQGVMGMSEKTLNEISLKMKAISNLRADTQIGSNDIATLNKEYARLAKEQDKVLGRNQELIKTNNALGRAFNYVRNRLVFALSVGSITQFTKQLYEIRGQYELLERSLGVLVNSFSRGSEIFAELNAMAVKSPYTLIELGTAAKQLTAYNFEAREVVNTTKRLADIASALGVPIERLVYNLGQIRAQTVLTARDARDFANAGLAIVPELSKYYTELEGKAVSTADVFDRMKKRAVSYNDVMVVLNKVTDEGGKFFDFQAKQAGTLKVQLANLNLAWNNMLNSIGKSNQSMLSWPVSALKTLFKSWKSISDVIRTVIISYGLLKLGQIAYLSYTTANSGATLLATATNWKFVNSLVAIRNGLLSVIKSPLTYWMLLITTFMGIVSAIDDAKEAIESFNKSIRDSAKENVESIKSFLEDYSTIRERLTDAEKMKANPVGEEEAKKTWEAVKEQIELTSGASDTFISQLLSIENINIRLRKSFEYLETIKNVSAAMEKMGKSEIFVQQDFSKWWNSMFGAAGSLFHDSLYENVENYTKSIKLASGETEHFWERFQFGAKSVSMNLKILKGNLDDTYESLMDFVDKKKWGNNPEAINEFFGQISRKLIQEGLESGWEPQDVFNFQLEFEEYRSKATKKALENRLQEEKLLFQNTEDAKTRISIKSQIERDQAQLDNFEMSNGRGRVIWNEFTKWMENEQSSRVRSMYNKMTNNGKQAIDFTSAEWKKFVNEMANKFATENKLSQDDTFNNLMKWVNDANKMKIFIELIIGTSDEKTLYETLTEADKAADEAYNKMKRLGERVVDLNKKISESNQKKDYNSLNVYSAEREKALKEESDAQSEYNEALRQGGRSRSAEADAKKKATAANKANARSRREQAKAETELQKALKDELQIIDKVQAAYKKLTKAGASRDEALGLATGGFENSVRNINNVLQKYGIVQFDIKKFAGISNPREMLKMLEDQLNVLKSSNKAKPVEIKELEAQIDKIRVDAKEYDMKKITDGLNNELGKIKEEYELAVELDANPELGDMFANMFGIDVDDLPRTFGEAYDRANKVAISKLKELKADVDDFDLMSVDLTKFAEKQGIGVDSTPIKDLMSLQKTWRDMFKKNITETEKYLDDYVKKYGNMSDKIAEIEANRLHKIKQLNEAYFTEQMRKMPEYTAKLDAINKGAEREKGGVRFDEFKNSRLYVTMFENLKYVSTATLETIRQNLDKLKSEMGSLKPEQLKQIVQQFEKIDDELRRRNPFSGLIKNYHDYTKATGKAAKQAEKDLVVAQEKYDQQLLQVTALKEELEQKKASGDATKEELDDLRIKISSANTILKVRKEELENAIKLNEQYNLMKKTFGEQWQAIGKLAQVVATNLKSLGELRDYLKDAGVDFGDMFDGVVDSLQGVSEGMNQIVSSATSGDVFGVVTGTIKTVFGIGDAIASIFGDGAARTRKINREIKNSQEEVRRLNMAYKDLERTVNKAMGSQEIAAQRALIANKKLERDEIERQLRLEKSKRSKDRDEDAIKKYEETLQSLNHEIEDLGDSIVENLLGNNVKSAAEDFVDTWVSAWKSGENTLDAIQGKMDDVIQNLIKKAVASKVVGTLLQPFYNAVDQFASEQSEGGVELTLNELKALSEMANTLGININDALTALFANFESLGIIDKNGANAQLSALQQGIQGITEDTAGALEAYMNGVSQQVYYQSDLLTQIRDILVNFGGDVTIATNAQILLQLQQSFQVQMTIQNVLTGVLNASGLAFRVELTN